MRKNLFVAGLTLVVAFFLMGFTAVDEGKKTNSPQSAQQVAEKCQDKHAKGECKEHKQEASHQQCDDKSKEQCTDQAKCAEKHASGQCQGHEAGACKEKSCRKAPPKKDDKK